MSTHLASDPVHALGLALRAGASVASCGICSAEFHIPLQLLFPPSMGTPEQHRFSSMTTVKVAFMATAVPLEDFSSFLEFTSIQQGSRKDFNLVALKHDFPIQLNTFAERRAPLCEL